MRLDGWLVAIAGGSKATPNPVDPTKECMLLQCHLGLRPVHAHPVSTQRPAPAAARFLRRRLGAAVRAPVTSRSLLWRPQRRRVVRQNGFFRCRPVAQANEAR